MNRQEYMARLSRYLKKLPKSDYDDAIEHFEEYFDEVGEEGEQDLIKELGDPRTVATEILYNLLTEDKDKEVEEKKEKKKMSKLSKILLISTLLIFAAPVGIPFSIAILAILFAVVLFIGLLALTDLILVLVGIAFSLKLFWTSILVFPESISASLTLLGSSILSFSASMLCVLLVVVLYEILKFIIKKICELVMRKGGDINE